MKKPSVGVDALGYYRLGDRKARVVPSAVEPDMWILYVNERNPLHRWKQRYPGDLWRGAGWEHEAAELAAIAWCERGIMPEVRA